MPLSTPLQYSTKEIPDERLRGWKTLYGATLSFVFLLPVIATHVNAAPGSPNIFENLDTILLTLACWVISTLLLLGCGFGLFVRYLRKERVMELSRYAFAIALALHGLWWIWFIMHEANRSPVSRKIHGL